MAGDVEYLPSMWEALRSIPSATKQNKAAIDQSKIEFLKVFICTTREPEKGKNDEKHKEKRERERGQTESKRGGDK